MSGAMERSLSVLLPLFIFAVPAFAQDAPSPQSTQSIPGLMNPAISANGLFLAGAEAHDGDLVAPGASALSGQSETFGTGLSVQELEVQLQSAVDPYFRANLVLSLPGGEGIEAEEAYVTVVSVRRLSINIGKFKEPFGRENTTHTHALLTIDKSLVGQRVFGEEGLNDMGVDAALLLPTPWFSELTVGVDAGNNEVVYASGDPLGMGTMAHWKNLFDLGESTTLEAGLSGLTGANAYDGQSEVAGADLTLKSHGRANRQFNRVVWQNEFLFMLRGGASEDEKLGGLYSTLEYAFTKRFWAGGRFDWVGLTSDEDSTTAATLIAILAPTEFSAVRLQGQRQFLPGGHDVDSLIAQLNFTIGVHPAHSY
jgi:hypothetical protein